MTLSADSTARADAPRQNSPTTDTPVRALPQTSVPLNAREFFAVVDLSRPYIPELDETEDDDHDEAHAGCFEPHLSADGYTDCDGKPL
ncbi:hypothetical protein [Streptomyces sp. NPDC087538]|uniref:hypothetical protein n=1 Tax=Streptomyces sp. NPDC087538 TaxID=3365797 RepID=UPI00380B83F7